MTASDPSRRFIAPPGSSLAGNLAALWGTDPKLAAAVEAVGDPYPLEPSKSGEPTLALPTPDGRAVYLHSRHQPLDEAARQLQDIPVDITTYYILGLGLGYLFEQLFARASSEAIFCIFEPDARLLRTLLSQRDLTPILESPRILWFHKSDKADLIARLTPHSALISLGTHTVTHAPSFRLHPQFFAQAEQTISEFAAFCRTSVNTLILNSQKTAENVAANVAWYAASAGLSRLANRWKGNPAIIVSAGPSLRKNKHLLPSLAGNAVLIAVQTTLQPLLEIGVQPHYVTSLDYHEICTRFFEKLPKNLRTELIAEPKANPAVLSMMTGPVTILGNDFADSLLREMGLPRPGLRGGATVAHLSFYLAEYMGCDPIIFVGQDLGFSDGLCYAPGTSYEDVWRPELSRFTSVETKQWEQIARDRRILRKIPDIHGRPMYTEERLFAYLQQFERDFAQSRARIIDASEGGAAKRGTTVMTLAQAAARFCAEPLPDRNDPPPPLDWSRSSDCRASLRVRRDEAEQIAEISRQTLPLLEEIRDRISDPPAINRLIARIDQLRARMDDLGRTYDQVLQFTQQTELRRFQEDRRIAAHKLAGSELQKHQVLRDIDNVRAVLDAAQAFAALMDQVSAQLDEFSGQPLGRHREAA